MQKMLIEIFRDVIKNINRKYIHFLEYKNCKCNINNIIKQDKISVSNTNQSLFDSVQEGSLVYAKMPSCIIEQNNIEEGHMRRNTGHLLMLINKVEF